MNHIISPDRLKILKGEIIVKKYKKPERVGRLFLPLMSLEDRTGTLWEVVKSNEKADLEMGERLGVGDILKVRWGHVTSLGTEDPADGRSMYLVRPEDVFHRIKNTWSNSTQEE